jgi:hypothetical protein
VEGVVVVEEMSGAGTGMGELGSGGSGGGGGSGRATPTTSPTMFRAAGQGVISPSRIRWVESPTKKEEPGFGSLVKKQKQKKKARRKATTTKSGFGSAGVQRLNPYSVPFGEGFESGEEEEEEAEEELEVSSLEELQFVELDEASNVFGLTSYLHAGRSTVLFASRFHLWCADAVHMPQGALRWNIVEFPMDNTPRRFTFPLPPSASFAQTETLISRRRHHLHRFLHLQCSCFSDGGGEFNFRRTASEHRGSSIGDWSDLLSSPPRCHRGHWELFQLRYRRSAKSSLLHLRCQIKLL